MTEIQLGSGPSSSATHHITKTSRTLNRRYVVRPTNLAIEEAAHTSALASAEPTSAPSRLVNLRVHSADLVRANAEPEQITPTPVVPHVVEFGNDTADDVPPTDASLDLTQVVPPEDIIEPTAAILLPENTEISTVSTQSYYDDNSTVTTTTIVASPIAETNPEALAMSIAADYAAASLGSSATPAPEDLHTLENPNNSIDAVARVASEAIAAIRTATDPKEVAEQITSLQAFAEDIRSTSSAPEMLELSNTIETFINVAMKSDKIKEEVNKKLAAQKAAESQVKVTTAKKPTMSKSISPAVKPTTTTVKKPVASPKPATKRITTKPAARATRPTRRTATKVAHPQLVIDQDQALRKALRSVASMDDEPETHTKTAKKPQIKKKTSGKRFVLAFFCAIICVSAIVYFVGTNIPDISVKVAAMQTGIEATYPSYVPRDFSLSDISSENGKITLAFKGPDRASFTLTEEKSSWDSTTLLHNYVEPTWQNNYITTHEQGITLYISGASAAWVNGGVLYKIDAPSNSLTKKQLRNIVISM